MLASSDVEGSSVFARVKLAAFGVFHSMRERDSHQRVTIGSQSWSLFLHLVDALQVSGAPTMNALQKRGHTT